VEEIMNFKLLLLAAVPLLLASAPAYAETIDFSFTGELSIGTVDLGTGTVTGQIVGLADNQANQTPTAIYLTSYPARVSEPFTNWPSPTFNILSYSGVGTDIGGANSFTVMGGNLTAVKFSISVNTQEVSEFNFDLYKAGNNYGIENTVTDVGVSADTATFTPVSTSPVPEPSTLAVLIASLAGLSIIRSLGFAGPRKVLP
jgi:hypothetical protein